jgi:thiol-disulfide isomerase/thioredoxin
LSEAVELETHDDYLQAIQGPGKVVVLFTSPSWCGPCRSFEPHWKRAVDVVDDITFYEVRELQLDERAWAVIDCGITRNPTCELYQDGEFVRNVVVPQNGLPFINDIRS